MIRSLFTSYIKNKWNDATRASKHAAECFSDDIKRGSRDAKEYISGFFKKDKEQVVSDYHKKTAGILARHEKRKAVLQARDHIDNESQKAELKQCKQQVKQAIVNATAAIEKLKEDRKSVLTFFYKNYKMTAITDKQNEIKKLEDLLFCKTLAEFQLLSEQGKMNQNKLLSLKPT